MAYYFEASDLTLTRQAEEKIKDVLHFKNHSCSCDDCKSMCKKSPCLPTPEEVIRIMEAGFEEQLSFTKVKVDEIGEGEYMLICPDLVKDPSSTTGRRCVFLNQDNLCSLHDKGLKPLEGRLANHHKYGIAAAFLRIMVLKTWESELGKKILGILNQ